MRNHLRINQLGGKAGANDFDLLWPRSCRKECAQEVFEAAITSRIEHGFKLLFGKV